MTHWRAGQTITDGRIDLANAQAEDTSTRTTTSTSFVDVSTLSAAVVVPASGQVKVTLRATQRNSGATNTLTSWTGVGSTSGTVYSANDNAAVIVGGTNNVSLALTYRLTGMTVDETLTVTVKHRVGGGTGTFDYRYLYLEGCP